MVGKWRNVTISIINSFDDSYLPGKSYFASLTDMEVSDLKEKYTNILNARKSSGISPNIRMEISDSDLVVSDANTIANVLNEFASDNKLSVYEYCAERDDGTYSISAVNLESARSLLVQHLRDHTKMMNIESIHMADSYSYKKLRFLGFLGVVPCRVERRRII